MKKISEQLVTAVHSLLNIRKKALAKSALNKLLDILKTDVSENGMMDALRTIRREARKKLLSLAEQHCMMYPEVYHPVLIELHAEHKALQSIYNDSEFQDGDEENLECIISELRLTKESLKAVDSIHSLVEKMSKLIDGHPEARDAGYRNLLRVFEDIIIEAYSEALFRLSGHWPERFVLGLYKAFEDIVYFGYSPFLLFYNSDNEVIELVTPKSVIQETNVGRRNEKLDIMRNALRIMPTGMSGYMQELTESIAGVVISKLTSDLGGEDKIPAEVRYLMSCLKILDEGEIEISPFSGPEFGKSALTELTTAQQMLDFLCTQKNVVFLENDWFEFMESVKALPFKFAAEMLDNAHERISARIMNALIESSQTEIPESINCLLRLFHVATFTPYCIYNDSEVFDWILGRDREIA